MCSLVYLAASFWVFKLTVIETVVQDNVDLTQSYSFTSDSRKTLKKLVDEALEETKWRLMSDGISYRLGYLNGRLRAYEREEDIKNLVMKSKKLKSKQTSSDATKNTRNRTLKTPDGKEVIL